jgi:hypothetical protein
MEMLEFHVDGIVPFIIINVIKNIVGYVVDDYIVVVFVVDTVIDQHWFTINEI